VKSKKDVEKQAIGRAVRLGQKNNVKVMRFIMKNTIEQVMLNKN
jgi:SNF2 family DNA or RNA helicase